MQNNKFFIYFIGFILLIPIIMFLLISDLLGGWWYISYLVIIIPFTLITILIFFYLLKKHKDQKQVFMITGLFYLIPTTYYLATTCVYKICSGEIMCQLFIGFGPLVLLLFFLIRNYRILRKNNKIIKK